MEVFSYQEDLDGVLYTVTVEHTGNWEVPYKGQVFRNDQPLSSYNYTAPRSEETNDVTSISILPNKFSVEEQRIILVAIQKFMTDI